MTTTIDSLRRDALPKGHLPTAKELLQCIQNPGREPELEKYLADNPGFRTFLNSFVRKMNALPNNPDLLREAVISIRAYENWVSRGQPFGEDWQDWLAAEAELFPEALAGKTG